MVWLGLVLLVPVATCHSFLQATAMRGDMVLPPMEPQPGNCLTTPEASRCGTSGMVVQSNGMEGSNTQRSEVWSG